MSSTNLLDYIPQGLAAARPVTPNLHSAAIGFWYSTDSEEMSCYADGAWIEDVFGAAGGDMSSANNLSDVANVATARSNLGLGALAVLATINGSNWSGTDLAVA